jgi:tripartite-type tricarboxylate transporter receptor subunit TctC
MYLLDPMSIKLSEIISHPVVIDNKAGASGVIGADVVANRQQYGQTPS